jgi:hypothetical protein
MGEQEFTSSLSREGIRPEAPSTSTSTFSKAFSWRFSSSRIHLSGANSRLREASNSSVAPEWPRLRELRRSSLVYAYLLPRGPNLEQSKTEDTSEKFE